MNLKFMSWLIRFSSSPQLYLAAPNSLWASNSFLPLGLGTCPSSSCKFLILLSAELLPTHSSNLCVDITLPNCPCPSQASSTSSDTFLTMCNFHVEHSCLWELPLLVDGRSVKSLNYSTSLTLNTMLTRSQCLVKCSLNECGRKEARTSLSAWHLVGPH